MSWTSERVAELRHLWQQGQSTAEIGRRLGISKNAVVGKAHRLSLPSRPSPIRRQDTGKPAAKGPRCQWPIGDPRSTEFHFCEASAEAGKPYCQRHCQMAYTRGSSSVPTGKAA